MHDESLLSREEVVEKLEGWLAYASNGNSYKYRRYIIRNFNLLFPLNKNTLITNKKKHFNFLRKLDESNLEFSVQKTLFMFSKGMTVKDIAVKRELKESTIWNHIINLIEHKQILVSQVVSSKKIKTIIGKIKHKDDGLKLIKNRLKNSDISYDEIACVLASIKSKNKKVS